MSPGASDRDAERDAWLDAALRHAPDAGAEPPAAVRDAILREARAASAPPARQAGAAGPQAHAPGGIGAALRAFWDWLARPPVAAGFASILAATIIGLMWWDQPLDTTLDRPPPSAPVAVATAPAGPPVTTAPAATLGAADTAATAVAPPATSAAEAARESKPAAKATTPRALGQDEAIQAPAANADARRRDADPSTAPDAPDRATGTTTQERMRPQAPSVAPRMAPSPQPPASPETPLAKSRRAETRASVRRAGEGPADTQASQAPSADAASRRKDGPEPFPRSAAPALQSTPGDGSSGAAALRDERAALASRTPPAAVGAAPGAAGPAGATASILGTLHAQLVAERGRWTWSRDDGVPRTAADDFQAWLAQADATTRSASASTSGAVRAEADATARAAAEARMRAAADAARAAAEASARAPTETVTTLRLFRDGRLQATLRLDAAGVEATDAAGTVQRVPLDAAARAALRAALPP